MNQIVNGGTDAPKTRSARSNWPWYVFAGSSLIFILLIAVRMVQPSVSSLRDEAQRALAAKNPQLAIEKSRQVLAREPKSLDGWGLLAKAGALAGNQDVWRPAMQQIERISPQQAFELYITIGGQEMHHLHAASAELALRRAIAISADRPEPWRLLAQLLSVQGRPRETVECLMALIRLGDFSLGDLQTLAWPNLAIGDAARVDQLLAADPGNLVPMLSRVNDALNNNHAADAEKILWRILERHPDSSRAIAMLGRLLAERDSEEFPRWQREFSSRAIEEPESWIAQGIWLRNHGQTSAAARCFHQAVELDPRHLSALMELGQALQSLGETSLASSILEFGRHQQEISELSRRTEEQADLAIIPTLVARLEQVGRYWEAWAWCSVYLETEPGDKVAIANLQRLKGRLSPALARTSVEAVPGRDFDWSRLAMPVWSRGSDTGERELASSASQPGFEEESLRRGIEFHFENGQPHARTIVQTSGGGVAAIDYDRDGWCDLYFTQGGHDPAAATQSAIDRMFRNIDGGFWDVTEAARIREDRFSQGVASGDFDNDGFPDLYVLNIGLSRLLRNNGDGTFTDATAEVGLASTGWYISGAIADLDRDGNPDILSIRYAGGPDIFIRTCRDPSGKPGVCRPTIFPAEADVVALNSGEGRFAELCHEAGLDLPEGRGFGVVVADFNGDRRLDAFVANDQTANFLLIQDQASAGRLHFRDEAIVSGVAFDRDGYPQACMGVASDDLNGDGRPELFITNFASESATLYVSQAHGGYLDMTRQAGLRDATFGPLGFGTQFLDADLDGHPDLVILNGHIHDGDDLGQSPAMLPQLFRGLPKVCFSQVIPDDRTNFFNTPRVGRGLCVLDWNRDGQPDFAGSCIDGNAILGTNRSTNPGHWLAIEFVGVTSSRDAIGTTVHAVFADGSKRRWQATAGDGFAACNQRRLHWGLGANTSIKWLEIEWPSGTAQRLTNVRADTVWVAIENRSEPIEMRK